MLEAKKAKADAAAEEAKKTSGGCAEEAAGNGMSVDEILCRKPEIRSPRVDKLNSGVHRVFCGNFEKSP